MRIKKSRKIEFMYGAIGFLVYDKDQVEKEILTVRDTTKAQKIVDRMQKDINLLLKKGDAGRQIK